jgi:hypothetical protein
MADKDRTVELATHFCGNFMLQDLFKASALLRKHVGDLAKQAIFSPVMHAGLKMVR